MPQGYEVTNDKGERAWWDGKKLTPLNQDGMQITGAGKQTEGERTAGFLSSRVADSVKNLASINRADPGASKPNPFEAFAEGRNWKGTANFFRSGDRQKVVTNQLDLLDAALTLGTGAAYTREQLDNYRATYFPGLTDKPEAVAAKRQKLINLLESAKIKAGSAAPPILDQALTQAKQEFGGQQGAGQPAASGDFTSAQRATAQRLMANPQARSVKVGDKIRPFAPRSEAEFRSVPDGAWYIDDDGSIFQKGR